jgi:hypothetical protein
MGTIDKETSYAVSWIFGSQRGSSFPMIDHHRADCIGCFVVKAVHPDSMPSA